MIRCPQYKADYHVDNPENDNRSESFFRDQAVNRSVGAAD